MVDPPNRNGTLMLKKKIYIIVNHGGPAWWTHQTVLELLCSRKNTDKHCIALHYWCNCLIFKIKASLLSICRIYSVELNLSRWKPCQCYTKFLFLFFIAVVNVFSSFPIVYIVTMTRADGEPDSQFPSFMNFWCRKSSKASKCIWKRFHKFNCFIQY